MRAAKTQNFWCIRKHQGLAVFTPPPAGFTNFTVTAQPSTPAAGHSPCLLPAAQGASASARARYPFETRPLMPSLTPVRAAPQRGGATWLSASSTSSSRRSHLYSGCVSTRVSTPTRRKALSSTRVVVRHSSSLVCPQTKPQTVSVPRRRHLCTLRHRHRHRRV